MKDKKHANIDPVRFTSDVVNAFDRSLRGEAAKDDSTRLIALGIIIQPLTKFVLKLSAELDSKFSTKE